MKPVPPALSYTIRRLSLFLATFLLCSALLRSAGPLVALAVATVVSAGLSYFLLAAPREQMAQRLQGRMQKLNERIDASASAEDAALDAAEARRKSSGDVP